MGSGETPRSADRADALRVGALVLAAGAGRRFGGPKQLACVGGEPMVARVTRTALSVDRFDTVVVVTGARGDDVAAALPHAGERLARCAVWADGIGASLACGLAALGEVDAALVLLGDQPLVDGALIRRVLADGLPAIAGAEPPYDAVRPTGRGGDPGHPVLLGPAALAAARTLHGDRGALASVDRARILSLELGEPGASFDVDQPEDLVAARAMVRGLCVRGPEATVAAGR
ncbi:MAG: nucleotidyltransferase family protein [Solirubrobacteraceae bacterium]|nr:nucleotidyltransferase family protein [Patulibacter sp.]